MKRYPLSEQFAAALTSCGIDPQEVLRRAQLPADTFSSKYATVTDEQYCRLVEAAGYLATSDDAAVHLATFEGIERFNPPVFAAFCSRDGRSCIERLAQHKRLIGPIRFEVSESSEAVRVEICPGGDIERLPRFSVECEFAFLVGLLRSATKEHIVPLRACMVDAGSAGSGSSANNDYNGANDDAGDTGPDDAGTSSTAPGGAGTSSDDAGSALAAFLGCPIKHDSVNALEFHPQDLAIPFISHSEAMWEFIAPELRRRLDELETDETTAARLRTVLVEMLPAGECTADGAARRLGLSKRSLQRALTAEGTSFAKQLSHTRELLARRYLSTTQMPTEEIAYLLGYVEHNSFLRAFSSWTGTSPAKYRASFSN